jgi:hypothetical protein
MTLKFLVLQGAPYIYDISRLRVKMDLQEVGCRVWTGLSWLRIETGGRHL